MSKTKVKKGISDFTKTSDYCPKKQVGKFYFTVDIENLSESGFHEIKHGEIASKIEKIMNSGVIFDESKEDWINEKRDLIRRIHALNNEKKELKNVLSVINSVSSTDTKGCVVLDGSTSPEIEYFLNSLNK